MAYPTIFGISRVRHDKTRVSRSEGVIEAILEGLEEGGTLTSICEAPGMPSIRAVQKWQRNDDELDEKVLRAWIRRSS